MNIDKLYDKLTKLNINISAREICSVWGMDEASFSRKKKAKTEIKLKNLQKLEEYLDVKLINDLLENEKSNCIDIPVLGEVTASCGNGITVYNEMRTGTYKISYKLAKDIGLDLNRTTMILASGDSMSPTIEGGDSLIVDLSKTEIHDGRIYCIRVENQVYAKRLQLVPPKTVVVISDNPKYEKFKIDFAKGNGGFDFEVLGEVKWWGRVAR